MEGIVKWFSAKKGYGFIETSEGTDVFVHFSAIKHEGYKNLNKGDKVNFNTIDSARGIQATDVTVLEKEKKKEEKKEEEKK